MFVFVSLSAVLMRPGLAASLSAVLKLFHLRLRGCFLPLSLSAVLKQGTHQNSLPFSTFYSFS